MKNNKPYLAGILALASLIVAPAISFVNHSQESKVAEGSPLPPPVPKLFTTIDTELVAEGSPLPPPVPKLTLTPADTPLIAEGSPLPPPVPKGPMAEAAIA